MYLHVYKEGGSRYEEVGVNEDIISIGILVVNDDQTCQNNVAKVLRCCKYKVLHTGTVYDALHAIWENKDRLDLVITNAHKLKSQGLAIIQNIKQKLELNVLLINNDERINPKCDQYSFSAYELNGLSVKGFDILLENARRTEEDKISGANGERTAVSDAGGETNKVSSSMNDAECLNRKQKGAELYGERSEDESRDDDHDRPNKKTRVNWTDKMHKKFLVAVERLGGPREAVPKKIVEVMGVPGLTRENVASHLQKYRDSMKGRRDEAVDGLGGSRLAYFPAAFSQSSYNIPTFRTIGASNMTQCTDKANLCTKFVGYRIEGNKIDYGPIKNQNSTQSHQPVSRIHGTQTPDLLSSDINQQPSTLSRQISTTSLMLPHHLHQDPSFRPESCGNGFTEQSPVPFVDDILQQHCSPPSSLPQMFQDFNEIFSLSGEDGCSPMNGIGNAIDQFDFPELDDIFFSPDD